ncbi:MAG: prolipoprotein diacylglyceryl transferase family protein, partial [Oscillospiraceae bacterium]|nr:prolipoprotein diacylglyceryl transferase family protein [Oscillospiraceae bacterium]
AEAAIFVLLLYHLKKRVRGSALTAIYLLSYGVLRFVLEFFRGDSYRGMLYGLSLSQYISILGIVVGSVIASASRRYTNSADYN